MRYIYNTGGILLSNEVYIYIILEEYYYQMRYIYILKEFYYIKLDIGEILYIK